MYAELSLVKSENQTEEENEESEWSEATLDPNMQEEAEALVALKAAVCETKSAGSELPQDANIISWTLKKSYTEAVTYVQEIEQCSRTTESFHVEKNISPSAVKTSCEAIESSSGFCQSLISVNVSSLAVSESSHARSESSQARTKFSTMIMNLTPAPVKLFNDQASIGNGHSHTLPRKKKQEKKIPTTQKSAIKEITQTLGSAPKKPNV